MATKREAAIHSDDMLGSEQAWKDENVIDLMDDARSAMDRFNGLEIITNLGFEFDQGRTRMERDKNDKRAPPMEVPYHGSVEYEAFMAEPVIIEINETSDENAPPVVLVGCNGNQKWLPRARPVKVPRAFVEILASSVERRYKTPKVSASDGIDNERPVKGRSVSSYPFSLVKDTPRGKAWLKMVFEQGRQRVTSA